MSIYNIIAIFFLSNILFTYFIWLFIKIKEVDIGLIKFYLFGSIICLTLVFILLKNYLLLSSIILHILFLLLHPSIQTSKAGIGIFWLFNTFLFGRFLYPVISKLTLFQIISFVGLGINSALSLKNLILGHWYLVTPGMSIKHFKNTNIFFSIVSLIRTIMVSIIFILLTKNFSIDLFIRNFLDAMFIGKVIFLQISPFIISLMSLNALSYKSTQAATGLFYIVVVLTGADFMVAMYLLKNNYYVF